jgi:DNA-binding protein H-NS
MQIAFNIAFTTCSRHLDHANLIKDIAMTTYKEIKAQIALLQRQAEELRQSELSNAIEQIISLMTEYDITFDEIQEIRRRNMQTNKRAVKYRDASGNTWAGRGRKPAWLQGKDIEQFRV